MATLRMNTRLDLPKTFTKPMELGGTHLDPRQAILSMARCVATSVISSVCQGPAKRRFRLVAVSAHVHLNMTVGLPDYRLSPRGIVGQALSVMLSNFHATRWTSWICLIVHGCKVCVSIEEVLHAGGITVDRSSVIVERFVVRWDYPRVTVWYSKLFTYHDHSFLHQTSSSPYKVSIR